MKRSRTTSVLILLILSLLLSTLAGCAGKGNTPSTDSTGPSNETPTVATYVVTFESNGGSAVSPMKVLSGQTISKPADPVRDGYYFVGWYTDQKYTVPFDFAARTVTSDLTLYAYWVEIGDGEGEFTLTFQPNGGDEQIADRQTIGGKLLGAPTPKRNGYTFKGWYVSQYGEAAKPSYVVTEDTVFEEDTTLYALWEPENLGSKLSAPAVSITGNGISWDAVGAVSYSYEITGPEGFTTKKSKTATTSLTIDFNAEPAGDYVIQITATAAKSANNSETVTYYYRNKALSRVSSFVVTGSVLEFNRVANAEEYLIYILCGDEGHNHYPLNNGNSNTYDFSNCAMREGGMEFVITARADGFMDATSDTFTYNRVLPSITGLRVDAATQILSWGAVEGATEYLLSITCSNASHSHSSLMVTELSYDLKSCGLGDITVNVLPKARGYNSPAASTLSYNKTTPATPAGLRVVGMSVIWDAVSGAERYSLTVNGKSYTATTNRLDLSTTDVVLTSGAEYVLAVSATAGSSESLPSDQVTAKYLGTTAEYEAGTLSWTPVIGAVKYEISVNGTVTEITDGASELPISLTQKGNNTITFRYFTEGDAVGSAKTEITVTAYQITFHTGAGAGVSPMFVAKGDRLTLPVSTRNGYTFGGWYLTEAGAENNAAPYAEAYFTGEADMELYAGWIGEKVTVILNNGTNSYSEKVNYNEAFTLDVPTTSDQTKVFLGWFDSANKQYTDAEGKGLAAWSNSGSTELFARWAEALKFTKTTDPANTSLEVYSVSQGPDIGLVKYLTVPAEYNGLPVRLISGLGFSSATALVGISIPDTVTVIGTDAFSSCRQLERVEVYSSGLVTDTAVVFKSADGVLLEKNMLTGKYTLCLFPAAKTGEYRVPDGVAGIGVSVFLNARISKLIIPVDVVSISSRAFENCTLLTEIVFEQSDSAQAPALSIADAAFVNCTSLTEITLPRRLSAFGEVSNGTNGVFSGCGMLSDIFVEANNVGGYSSADGVLLRNSEIIYYPEGRGSGAYTIPGGVGGVAAYAFYGNAMITELTVPVWVSSIGEYAFAGSSVTKVTFLGNANSNSSVSVKEHAFDGCTRLASVVFESGSRVTRIGNCAFAGCVFTTVTLPASLQYLGDEAFGDSSQLKTVNFESNTASGASLELGASVFRNTGVTALMLPVQLSHLDLSAFGGIALASVGVEAGNLYYTSVDGVLYDAALKTLIFFPSSKGGVVTFPDSLESINAGAFKGNTQITSVTFGPNVTYIGAEAFRDCTGLLSIVFEEGEGTIEFGTATPIQSSTITLPEGGYTFADCTAVTTLVLNRIKNIPNYFTCYTKGMKGVQELTIPDGVESIGVCAFYYLGYDAYNVTENKVTLTLPNSLKSIGDKAFAYAYGLSEVVLPASLESVGEKAFAGCKCTITVMGQTTGWNSGWKTSFNGTVVYGSNED